MTTRNVAVRLAAEGGQQVRAELIQVGDAGEQMGVRLSRGSAIGKAGLQNIGFQVQDFAVQVGAGTSATQALAQQLPQLLSGFGPIGVAVGTLAAVGLPLLTYALSDTGEKAKEVKEHIDALVRATVDFQTTANALRLGVDEVEVETVVALNKALKERARLEEQIRAANAANLAAGQLPGEGLADLQREYALVSETVRELSAKVEAYRAARDEAGKLAAENDRSKVSVEQMNEKLAGAYALYANLLTQAGDLANENERAAKAAAALAAYDKFAGFYGSGPDAARSTVQFGGGQFAPPVTGAGLPKPPVRPSGGGGVSAQNAALREATQIYEQTRTAAEKYSAEVEKLNALQAQFPTIIDSETYRRALDDLKGGLSSAKDYAEALEGSFESAFVSFVTGASSAKEAAAQLLGQLAELFAQSAFQSLIGGSGFFGAVGGFLAGGRAGGGPVEAGRSYMVGESGPERVFMTGNGYVVPNNALRGGGSGGGVTIIQNIDARGAVEGTADLIDRKLRAAMPDLQRQAVAATLKAKGRGFQ